MKRLQKQIFMLAAVLLTLAGCSPSDALEEALSMSGDNRQRLESALERVAGDSLKRRAMEYLIVNSQYRAERTGKDLERFKTALKNSGTMPFDKSEWQSKDLASGSLPPDVTRLSDTLLLDNVNLAVDVWRSRPWHDRYSEEDFFNYVLPYRIADEPLENWRRAYLDRYAGAFDSICSGVEDPLKAARLMLAHVKSEGIADMPEMNAPHLGAFHLFNSRRGYCRDHCDLAIYVLRSLGIPVATDMYENSPSYNSRHFWTAAIGPDHTVAEFNISEPEYSWGSDMFLRVKGKVYREMFAPRASLVDGTLSDKVHPFFRNPFLKDVSDEYGFECAVKFDDIDEGTERAYLSFYDGRKYVPVAMAEINEGSAEFENFEPNLICFPTVYNTGDRTMYPMSFPMLSGERWHVFAPDTLQTDTVRIWRKYPMRRTRRFLNNAIWMKFRAYKAPDTRKVFEYEVLPPLDINVVKVPIPGGVNLRYLSLNSYEKHSFELSELMAFSEGGIVKPVSATDLHSGADVSEKAVPVITDDKWDTFYSAEKGGGVMLDFGREIRADSLMMIPRTDDNFVHPGDEYELFYHAGKEGWKSLGRKTAKASFIDYSVPRNAVLWLKNHTRGKEERPFYFEEGIQIFP